MTTVKKTLFETKFLATFLALSSLGVFKDEVLSIAFSPVKCKLQY